MCGVTMKSIVLLINVGRHHEVQAVGLDLWPQVIHDDHEDVLQVFGAGDLEGEAGGEKEGEGQTGRGGREGGRETHTQ